ncbi:MAG: class I SAM-dependent methyltransferase [Bacteriovoracaceae bacterium]
MKEVKLHPATIKHLKKGHPWITSDSYTKKFPNDEFLLGRDEQGKPFCLFFHDRFHATVKGRLWELVDNFNLKNFNFIKQLTHRLELSFQKRTELKVHEERENFYLVFGEADNLPGLFIQHIGKIIVIQYYSLFWEKYLSTIVEVCHTHFGAIDSFSVQNRMVSPKESKPLFYNKAFEKITPNLSNYFFRELNYCLKLIDNSYDLGVFTDMSAIRAQISNNFKADFTYLNLFAYTGAFSLLAHSKGAKAVVSIDLSSKYLAIYKENLIKNNFNLENDLTLCQDVVSGLNSLIEQGRHFDFIICDPPSFSSDGEKSSSALNTYEKIIEKMVKLLNANGYLLLFLNTHHISAQKFEAKIAEYFNKFDNFNKNFKIVRKLKLARDCPTLPHFPEGNYLKGLLLQKK